LKDCFEKLEGYALKLKRRERKEEKKIISVE
jgi:hypothetical protein